MNWFEHSPTARMMAELPGLPHAARCLHGTDTTMFCKNCYVECGGSADYWDQYETPAEHEGMTHQDLWDMQDAMRDLNTAVQSLTQRLEAEKKNPPLFPGEG